MIGDKKTQDGFSIIELLVAFAVFISVVTVTVSIFVVSIKANRSVLAEKRVSENVNFAVEFMSRQLRVAQKFDSSRHPACGTLVNGQTFTSEGLVNGLYLISHNNQCIRFFWGDTNADAVNDSIMFQIVNLVPAVPARPLTDRDSALIEALDFYVMGGNETDPNAPRVTIVVEARGEGNSDEEKVPQLDMQTTVTARGLDTP